MFFFYCQFRHFYSQNLFMKLIPGAMETSFVFNFKKCLIFFCFYDLLFKKMFNLCHLHAAIDLCNFISQSTNQKIFYHCTSMVAAQIVLRWLKEIPKNENMGSMVWVVKVLFIFVLLQLPFKNCYFISTAEKNLGRHSARYQNSTFALKLRDPGFNYRWITRVFTE